MINVSSANELVADNFAPLKIQEQELNNLSGKVLAEDILASRQQPPFDRVAMDGIAVHFQSSNIREYNLAGIQKAGEQPSQLKNSDQAIEVMTGAVCPDNCTTVIPYEQLNIKNEKVQIDPDYDFADKKNIHFAGSDYNEGELLLKKGSIISATEISLIAGQGKNSALTYKFPKTAIISTGDELVEPGKTPLDWQIWRSNPYAIAGLLTEFGASTEDIKDYHLDDDKEQTYSLLKNILDEYELIILSGGVSAGKYDFVPSALEELGVKKIFHKIKQKPGKPLFFGSTNKGQNIFGLPGNPVSALVCLRRYFISQLHSSYSGIPVKLSSNVRGKEDFTFFKSVCLINVDGELWARPQKSNGSGDFSSISSTSGFVELQNPNNPTETIVNFYSWRRSWI